MTRAPVDLAADTRGVGARLPVVIARAEDSNPSQLLGSSQCQVPYSVGRIHEQEEGAGERSASESRVWVDPRHSGDGATFGRTSLVASRGSIPA